MIKDNQLVKLTYDLYVEGEEENNEELVERAPKEHPLVYVHGIGMMLPKFEESLAGKQAGDAFDFRIDFTDAYGEYEEKAVLDLPRNMFFIDGKFDSERVVVGNIIPMNTSDGQIVQALVVEVGNENVTIDLNHPLAGENLHFVGTILEEREATQEEIDQLTKGCSCGCDQTNCNQANCNSQGCNGCC